MVMESLKLFERKFDYRISGHSGDTDSLILVPWGKPPTNDKMRLDVLRAMHAHTEMCDSGDTTLEAARKAIFDVAGKDADDRFVFLVSDANLQQYSITPDMLARIFSLDKRVHVFLLFIASPRDSTSAFVERWPSNVFVCLDKRDLPRVLKKMFQVALRE
jgi:Mg2+ and Co2+ transporter CorA